MQGIPARAQFPRRQAAALQHRARLVGDDVHPPPRLVRPVYRRQRRADAAGRERAGITVGEHDRPVGNERQAVLPYRVAHRAILGMDRHGLRLEGGAEAAGIGHGALGNRQHAIDGPAQVDRGRTGGGEQSAGAVHPLPHGGGGVIARLAGGQRHPHGPHDPDEWSTPHPQVADRLGDLRRGVQREVPLFAREERLVEHHQPFRGPCHRHWNRHAQR